MKGLVCFERSAVLGRTQSSDGTPEITFVRRIARQPRFVPTESEQRALCNHLCLSKLCVQQERTKHCLIEFNIQRKLTNTPTVFFYYSTQIFMLLKHA